MIATHTSILKRFADSIRINKKFSKRGCDIIDKNPKYIVSPVDATLFCHGSIDKDGYIISKHGRSVSLSKLIGKYADAFHGGTYLNLYLSPKNRHYFVIPYDGTVKYIQKNEGKAVIPVILGLDNIFGNQRWFSKAAEKNANIGVVVDSGKSAKFKKFSYAIIAVGSLNVNNITIDCLQGKKYVKGAYAGHFSVGSTVILCFDKTLGKYSKLLMQDGQKTAIGENIFKINSI